ncbi:hypothetical protein RclHR1_03450006 [Rhizophagus clarus]|uniref:Protein kinase domain-containing protein n=1 Tax=Rhizophagus clarus TaxID=94130 RepID=A0A2Z6RRS8_9GLOM|nr:hypothetical protein RclHR1_03450006 [Rhizophagus clarus]GES74347.1 hypothetical protein RCL_jg9942.t1 [Rhizophagus clarus]
MDNYYWEDADGYPNNPANHLTSHEHAPEVFQQNQGEEIDIWSVGKLIIDASRWIIGLSQNIIQFEMNLQSNDRPNCQESLETI